MLWLGLVSNAVKALGAYWELKAERFTYDLISDLEKECDAIQEKIETLRDAGTNADSELADRLRIRLRRKSAYLERISTKYFKDTGGATGADTGRDLHPTS
jgi:hypothetical protein